METASEDTDDKMKQVTTENQPEFGGIRVVCSSRITGTDLGTVALVISSFTTATDLVAMVITKCKVTGIKAEDYCVVMETGYKDKGGGLETKILQDEDNPLTMQASKPKGQVRFGVQPRNGIVVKVYDGRVWPVTVFGDVYITTEFTCQLVIHHLLSSSLPKKQLAKYTLAIGTSQGKIQRFLNDIEQPVRVLQDPSFKSGEDVCFLIVKKPKAAKKPMFRSLSWASINKPTNGEQMSHLEGTFSTEGRKQKKYRLKKKKDGKTSNCELQGSSDTTSSEEFLHQIGKNLTSTPIKGSKSVTANGQDKVSNGVSGNPKFVYVNGHSRGEKTQSGNFSLSGMPQNSSLTSFFSCDNIPKAAPLNSDSESEMSSTEIIEERRYRQPPKYSQHTSSHTQEQQREAEDTLSDLQVVLRTRSLGDLTTNQGLSLSSTHTGLQECWPEAEEQTRYVHSAGSSRTVVVNPPTLKRDVPRQRPNRQNRRSCVARIEDKENRDYLEDYCGRSLQKTPRQRRSLPQIPNNDIDEKKRRFAELMMRRLTVCNGEIASYLQESGHITGSLNEIRDGRYISSAHIHLTPSESVSSQQDLSPPDEQEFEQRNRYQGSPVAIISSPRSPETLLSRTYYQGNARRRTPDPFNDSPKMARMPLIQERETVHTPLSRIAKTDAHQYQTPRSRIALIEAQTDPEFQSEKTSGYHDTGRNSYQETNGHGYNGNSTYNGRSGQNYTGNYGSGYYSNTTHSVQYRSRETVYHGNRAHSYHGSSTSNNYGNNPYGTLPRGVNSGGYPQEDLVQFSTLPRPEKTDYASNGQRVAKVISPGKPLSESGSDPGHNNVASRGSMVDSGYGTNGESDYGALPGRPIQPQKIYAKDRQGILKQQSNEFTKSSDGSFERNSLESPPDPVTTNPAPSLHQLMSLCNIHPVRLTLPPNKVAADLIHIHEDSINLPSPRYKDSEKSADSPKGRYAVGLGGPGSAFRRVTTPVRNTKYYNLVSVENINKNCQPKQGDVVVEKGDILLEINGQGTLGWDFSAVLSILESIQGGQLEVVVARKRPQERGQETLSSEISKLRQQCAYLITEVKSKEQIITDLSNVGSPEPSPRQSQSLTLDPPITRQEAYYTCELSEDEFIV